MTNRRHVQGASANRKGTTWGSVRRWHQKSHATILRPHAITTQSSVAVTHLHTVCCSFYLPRRDGILSRDCLLRNLNPDHLHAWVNMRRSGQRLNQLSQPDRRCVEWSIFLQAEWIVNIRSACITLIIIKYFLVTCWFELNAGYATHHKAPMRVNASE